MKKILLLGGSAQQIIAIETAKKLGYYTVLCDYLPDNPGQNYADVFYQESTTDKEAILKVAQAEQIDGIIAYASDPAAPTAAYVAEKMNLPSSPYESVEILCNKDRFRAFLSENGFCTPRANGYTLVEDALCDIEKGVAIFTPQDHEKATFCKMLTKQDSIIDWSLPAQTIVNRIRAFDYMGSSTTKNGELIKIYSAIVTDGVGDAGEVIEADTKTGVKVACGENAIIIGQMLTAGGKRTLSTDAVKGRKISLGDILGK